MVGHKWGGAPFSGREFFSEEYRDLREHSPVRCLVEHLLPAQQRVELLESCSVLVEDLSLLVGDVLSLVVSQDNQNHLVADFVELTERLFQELVSTLHRVFRRLAFLEFVLVSLDLALCTSLVERSDEAADEEELVAHDHHGGDHWSPECDHLVCDDATRTEVLGHHVSLVHHLVEEVRRDDDRDGEQHAGDHDDAGEGGAVAAEDGVGGGVHLGSLSSL